MSIAQARERSLSILREASGRLGLPVEPGEPIRLGENAVWRLPGEVVARIARPGQQAAARKEIAVARWLSDVGLPAVRPLDVEQPVEVRGHSITYWHELPPHRRGTPAETASVLRRLHSLQPPTTGIIGPLDPFVRLDARIATAAAADIIDTAEQDWLRAHLRRLHVEWEHLPQGRPHCVIHGDAWIGNLAVTPDGTPHLLDLERCAIGPPEWDLTSTAAGRDLFAHVSTAEYEQYTRAYGYDVTSWKGFPILRGVRELRVTLFALQYASDHPGMADRARHRLECLQGHHGPRPWDWPVMD
ncbi:aminoglycoside phosphotransferase family protein [Peterkaempfera bronchialis]|uniref:Aminoglycoside phosphotransferase family protein n=1 Tax=Peterkaempfera bronchialis TaxID=2126346 RepID=A0A345SUR1_9ACTN|nr:aminoglycoside phosphotransferase family protein [Peterkaempfera bronchialis]AXI77466.1 aminoglycoside phosphotransferase family protein [Peterkaempfera bronchialis]